jgi:Zn-dependent protease
MQDTPDLIFSLVVLIFSVILHEVAHGYMANWLGDPTARLQGRLTLNPLKHIDPVGSVILPIILLVVRSPMLIGYAKPVPYNPYNLQNKYGETLVAGAGPATNILLAIIFGLALRLFGVGLNPALFHAFAYIVLINIMLAIFNLIPIPPLDGSKVLSGILPGPLKLAYDQFRIAFERLGVLSGTLILLILFYYLLSGYFAHFIVFLYTLLTGLTFIA